MESTESRFAHLLQPIRELTKNWDIDVASELNDYLEEVSSLLLVMINLRHPSVIVADLLKVSVCVAAG